MRLHILFRKGVLGFALAGLVVGSAAAQAQDKDDAKDAAKAKKDGQRHPNTKQPNKPRKPKTCPFCVPPLPNKWGDLDKSHLLNK